MIRIFTIDGIGHVLPDAAAIADYSTSAATRAALTAAYEAGNWQNYQPPVSAPPPPEPNPSAFRVELARAASWIGWAASLPSVHYTNLVIAAAQDNWSEAQALYVALASSYPPSPSARAEWQTLADTYGIELVF